MDQFTQRYAYDHDQRITSVSTSRDGVMWEHEAAYAYFAHGPLKRMELGQDSVQGTDYAYTINGWLKGINMPSLSPDHDPGGDGAATGPNTGFARDAFGMILGYHEKDFVKSGSVYDSSHSTTSSWHVPNPTFLYNGNISSWSSNSRRASGATDTALASVYHYDLLNRIRSDSTRLRGATAWSAVGSHWQSDYTYDGNGNITTLYRANASGSQMDNLTYEYISGTNKLVNINDYQGASTGADIGDQGGNNYAYDATGNMTQDTAAGIEAGGIVWSPYNKIKSITKMGDDTTSKLVYLYDATGNRILKRYYKPYNTLKSTTWYVRDAQGNTLATYTKPSDSTTARQKEVMLYGSTRLAVAETHAPYSDSETDTLGIFDRVSSRTLGEKRYELTDHLGNVRATVSDVVIDHSGDLDAEISTRTDYYPFGMIMGGRNSSLDGAHRYGFNGKENDNEVKGEGNSVLYGERLYDPRTVRWISTDALEMVYAHTSTYSNALGSPIRFVDADGGIVTDVHGNIIVKETNQVETAKPLKWKFEVGGRLVQGQLQRKYKLVNIFADDGTPIRAKILIEAYIEYKSPFDDDVLRAPTGKDVDAVADCHGLTFAENRLWIDDQEVNSILKHDGYAVTERVNADIVVFRDGKGEVYHSARRTADDTYDNNAGIRTTQYGVSLRSAERNILHLTGSLAGYGPGRFTHYEKAQPNTRWVDSGFVGPLQSNEQHVDFEGSTTEGGMRVLPSDSNTPGE